MAERKSPQTEPVKDNSAGEHVNRRSRVLSETGFNQIIKSIKNGNASRRKTIVGLTSAALERLELKPQPKKAVKAVPESGSDQFDGLTFKLWTEEIESTDADCVNQLIAIDATARG